MPPQVAHRHLLSYILLKYGDKRPTCGGTWKVESVLLLLFNLSRKQLEGARHKIPFHIFSGCVVSMDVKNMPHTFVISEQRFSFINELNLNNCRKLAQFIGPKMFVSAGSLRPKFTLNVQIN